MGLVATSSLNAGVFSSVTMRSLGLILALQNVGRARNGLRRPWPRTPDTQRKRKGDPTEKGARGAVLRAARVAGGEALGQQGDHPFCFAWDEGFPGHRTFSLKTQTDLGKLGSSS